MLRQLNFLSLIKINKIHTIVVIICSNSFLLVCLSYLYNSFILPDLLSLIDCQARYKCPFENMKFKLRTKAENLYIEPKLLLMLAYS
jgi:hypothetical protein